LVPSCVGTDPGAALEAVASKTKRLECGCAHKQLAKTNRNRNTAGERITHIPFKARTFNLKKEQTQHSAPKILCRRNLPPGIASWLLMLRYGCGGEPMGDY